MIRAFLNTVEFIVPSSLIKNRASQSWLCVHSSVKVLPSDTIIHFTISPSPSYITLNLENIYT